MGKIDFLYQLSKSGVFNDGDIVELYKADAESYDYENHKHNEKIEEILKSRNIRTDLAHILHCPEDQVAYLNERMDPGVKYLYTGLHIVDLETHQVLNGKNADMKKFLEYKPALEKKSGSELIKNCQKNSIGLNNDIEYKPVIKMLPKEEVIKKITTAVKCISVAGVLVSTVTAVNVLGSEDNVSKFLNDHRHLVTDEKVRTDNNSGYYYLHGNIAKSVLASSEDKDSLIYAVYNEVRQDAATINGHDESQIDYNMDLIMKDLSFNSDEYNYSNFDEYLISKNFVNENGKVDTKLYDSVMKDYINNIVMQNEFKFDGGKSK